MRLCWFVFYFYVFMFITPFWSGSWWVWQEHTLEGHISTEGKATTTSTAMATTSAMQVWVEYDGDSNPLSQRLNLNPPCSFCSRQFTAAPSKSFYNHIALYWEIYIWLSGKLILAIVLEPCLYCSNKNKNVKTKIN